MSASYQLIDLAKDVGLPVVATNNVHYCEVGEYKIKELLVYSHNGTADYCQL